MIKFIDFLNESKTDKYGYVLYYLHKTEVVVDGGEKTTFIKDQAIAGPFKDWDEDKIEKEIRNYDYQSRKNLTYGWGIIKRNSQGVNIFVELTS